MHTHTHTKNLILPQTQTGRSCCQGSALSAVSLVSIYCASVISGKRGACADPEGCQEQYPPDPQRLPSAERQRRMLNKKRKKESATENLFFFPGSDNPKFILLAPPFSLRWIHRLKGLPLSAEGGPGPPISNFCSLIAR